MITLKVNMTTNQNYYTQTLTVKCIKLKLKMSTKILATIKKIFYVNNYATKSKYYDNSNKLVIDKVKDDTGGIHFWQTIVNLEKQKAWIEMLLQQ